MKPVPTEGRGSRLRGNDGLGAAGMTGFRRVVQRFLRFFGVRPSELQGESHSELPSVIPNGVRNLRSPSNGLPVTTTVFRVRRHLRDSLNKSPWMRRMDVKPVPTEGRGSRIRGNDGLGAAGMTGFRRVVQRFLRFFGVRPSE